ncbi:MAG TPA: glycosyltransferase [Anaeromyxobacter sp.]|nr:glycosyltransferase [Anaeromyxobacter sp.]
MRVLHVSTGLNLGGAETMLCRLLQARRPEDQHHVVSLLDIGPMGRRMADLGIETRALGMRRMPDPHSLLRLRSIVAELRPDVVQTWMYHADLLGGLAARLAGRPPVVWGLHNSTLDPARTRRTTRWVVGALARLSATLPAAIVTVSRAAEAVHVAKGYDARKFVFIPNGFDLTTFRPDPAARRSLRQELGLADEQVLIGMLARVSAQKDHPNFIRAAISLARRRPEVRFLLCGGDDARDGPGTTARNATLYGPIARAGLADRFYLLGQRQDAPRVLNALDVSTLSSSFGEAFPLVLGEAMACGVPCVATDVGDSAMLLADTGRIVPPGNSEALAAAWEAVVAMGPQERQRLGRAARARIGAEFPIEEVARRYTALWQRVSAGARAAGARPEDAAKAQPIAP